jgi:hypothetical protein
VQTSIQNKHTHVDANGISITHSHPFNKESETPINEHKHSSQEIRLFCYLNFDFYETTATNQLAVILDEAPANFFVVNDLFSYDCHFLKTIPRGPPTLPEVV